MGPDRPHARRRPSRRARADHLPEQDRPARTSEADDETHLAKPARCSPTTARSASRTLETSVDRDLGLDELRDASSRPSRPSSPATAASARAAWSGRSSRRLDLRVGAISGYTGKGRHTTTSARRYPLDVGGAVIDTPGVKLFGLWGVTRDNLAEFFPDVAADTARPDWRKESFDRILGSLPEPGYA